MAVLTREILAAYADQIDCEADRCRTWEADAPISCREAANLVETADAALRHRTEILSIPPMKIDDATRMLADNISERVVVRVARHEERSLPMIIADEVQKMLIRIAEKQGWEQWPSDQIRS